MSRIEIIIGGFGGQGVLLAGKILAEAAMHDGKNVVQTRLYGAEARGGAARSDVIISDEEIDYPLVIKADILIAMSNQAFNQYIDSVKEGSIIIIDEDLVKEELKSKRKMHVLRVPATRLASYELKYPIVANMIMIGVLINFTNIISLKSIIEAVKKNVSKKSEEINLKALTKGLEIGKTLKNLLN
ncbi:MAG: 2-oxoacid:acceptor oxidoreductase family protein [Candidatus Micrarchaeia archaeon]